MLQRDVAQFGSAHVWGAWSRKFKSCHPDQLKPFCLLTERLFLYDKLLTANKLTQKEKICLISALIFQYQKVFAQSAEMHFQSEQFFTRNPRGGSARKIDIEDVNALIKLMTENNFAKILAHAPYTMNLCSAKPETREFALNTLTDDLKRMEYLPNNLYNFHPGSHTGQGVKAAVEQIGTALNTAMFDDMTTTVLLETMAGKGTEVGRTFEELRMIIDRVERNDKIGVCLDTCHVFDAGYDIVNNLDGVLEEFDRVIGLERLKAIHLNDSMNPIGNHKDRHQKIGEGYIGIDAFGKIINNENLRNLPFFLETPNELDGYAKEISALRNLYFE